jgi:hypothetical protein
MTISRIERAITKNGLLVALWQANRSRSQLKTPYRDGTTHVIFERGGPPPLDFIAKLAALPVTINEISSRFKVMERIRGVDGI